MVVKFKILIPDGPTITARLAGDGRIDGLGIDSDNSLPFKEPGASLRFINEPQDSKHLCSAEWQPNGCFRYFLHVSPEHPPNVISDRTSKALLSIEDDEFKHATIELDDNSLAQLNYSAEAAVGIIYGGLQAYAIDHLAHPKTPLDLTLNLGNHSPVFLEMLLADIATSEQGAMETSISDLPVKPLSVALFDEKARLRRNSPTQDTFLCVIDGVVYCDPIVARMIRGAKGIQGSDEAHRGNFTAELNRASQSSNVPAQTMYEGHEYPDHIVDAFNMRQWRILVNSICTARMTCWTYMTISQPSSINLSEWLGQQTGLNSADLHRLIVESFEGSLQADLHFDANGFIVGAVVQKTEGHNKRGTIYEIGNTHSPNVAKQIWLTDLLKKTDRESRFAPINFKWSGTREKSNRAFLRWFYRSVFVATRQESVSYEKFKKAMVSQPSMDKRLAAMNTLLGTNAQLRDLVVKHFCENTLRPPKFFESYYRTVGEDIGSGGEIEPANHFMALCIELCLREVVGDEMVDRAIAQHL